MKSGCWNKKWFDQRKTQNYDQTINSTATGSIQDCQEFGVVIKMHKGGDERFLKRSGTVSTTQLSFWITRALTAMTTVSENLWRDTFSSVGIYTPRSWLAINSRAVRRQMSRMDAMKLRPPDAGQQTYDCSKMYTSIRLPELKAKMDKYIDMVFEN